MSDTAACATPSDHLTEENLSHVVWRLAWPSVLTMLLQFANGLVDMFFVGRLGPAAQATVGMGGQVVMMLLSLSMAVTTGATAIVARYVGASDRAGAAEAARQALLLSALLSLLIGLPLWLMRRTVLGWMGAAPEVLPDGTAYLAITTLAITPYFLLLTYIAVFQALGDMRTPLAIMVVVNGSNILLDALLIGGWGPVSALGVRGAAIASSSARVAGALLAAFWLARRGFWLSAAAEWQPPMEWAVRILRIGMPAALQAALRSIGAVSYTHLTLPTILRV